MWIRISESEIVNLDQFTQLSIGEAEGKWVLIGGKPSTPGGPAQHVQTLAEFATEHEAQGQLRGICRHIASENERHRNFYDLRPDAVQTVPTKTL
jgi:hypothetical protein